MLSGESALLDKNALALGMALKPALQSLGPCIDLAHLEDDETFTNICLALSEPDILVAIGASVVLGMLKNKKAVPFLLKAFLTTHEKKARAIAWALGEIGDARANVFLIEALHGHFVVKDCVQALGKIGSVSSFKTLLKALAHKEASVRALAAKALGQLNYEQHGSIKEKVLSNLNSSLKNENSMVVRLASIATQKKLKSAFSF